MPTHREGVSVQDSSPSLDHEQSSRLDTGVAHSARIWNYWLGGKDNFAADREVGDQIQQMLPDIVPLVRADRAFLGRAVRYLAGEAGIRQFLDVGTGLPSADNTHEVAQRIAPESRIVYVDNDPMVLVHARALLTSTPQGATEYVDADLNDPDKILQEAARTLDFSQPTALMLLGIVHFISDIDEAKAVVNRLLEPMPSGSYLAIAHATTEVKGKVAEEAIGHWNQFGKPPITIRSAREIASLFDGLELLEPGVVSCSRWRPEPADLDTPEVDQFCGVARKP
jgi:O-methyltransferase involved in polyketide biosynthesis